jgi:hypothetical protein
MAELLLKAGFAKCEPGCLLRQVIESTPEKGAGEQAKILYTLTLSIGKKFA